MTRDEYYDWISNTDRFDSGSPFYDMGPDCTGPYIPSYEEMKHVSMPGSSDKPALSSSPEFSTKKEMPLIIVLLLIITCVVGGVLLIGLLVQWVSNI